MSKRSVVLNQIVERVTRGSSVPEIAEAQDMTEAAVVEALGELVDVGLLNRDEAGYELAITPVSETSLGPYRLRHRYVVDSTNRWATRAGPPADPTVFLATVQTAGRGRHDRQWASPAGGLWSTLLITPEASGAQLPRLTLGMAVAVVGALAEIGVEAAIKWPNDVLIGGEKLAGILTEYTDPWARIGVGLNAAVPLDRLPAGATSLLAHGTTVERGALAAAVYKRFASLADQSDRILTRWRRHAATLGRRVSVTTGEETITGRAVDVASTGALQIETPSGVRTVTAGDCTHLRHRFTSP